MENTTTPAGWFADPRGRSDLRYWDGSRWTDHVVTKGVQGVDPLDAPLAPASAALHIEPVGTVIATADTERGPGANPVEPDDRQIAENWARLYLAACVAVMAAADPCVETGRTATGAREMMNKRPQAEISIAHFRRFAEEAERDFVPLYNNFSKVCDAARSTAASFLAAQATLDPELVLIEVGSTDFDAYNKAGIANHILRTTFGPTPTQFFQGIQRANAAIEADTVAYGEPGFLGYIYRPPAPSATDERVCPWCAETIKAAAIICRFCNREVERSSNAL